MENIKFIREIMSTSSLRSRMKPVGIVLVYPMHNGNVAKLSCHSDGVSVRIVSKTLGLVDRTFFPFASYFAKKRCSPGAPPWDQHIENGEWYFSQYPHCLPTNSDFKKLSSAVEEYLSMMDTV